MAKKKKLSTESYYVVRNKRRFDKSGNRLDKPSYTITPPPSFPPPVPPATPFLIISSDIITDETDGVLWIDDDLSQIPL